MIIVTGAAGFIGSCLAKSLADSTDEEIILVDDFTREEKASNLDAVSDLAKVERDELFEYLETLEQAPRVILHIGARTDTTEFDYSILEELNLHYTQRIWEYATANDCILVYASSAATYGSGEFGYDDDHDLINKLEPLNPYGISKNEFDKWALAQTNQPKHWYGLKFFNVYGPNEYHKGRMASVILHAFNQIQDSNKMKLFESHNSNYKNGEQLRDFVYVKDVIKVIEFLVENNPSNGLYNLGTGRARTFLDLTKAVFKALDVEENIEFVPTPIDIRDKYQYFTEANMAKLVNAGFQSAFTDLESGVEDYVKNYLVDRRNY